MEDQDDEWMSIQKYSSPEESNTTKLSWILSKGLGLGKKVVVTSVVISTAPLVLPQLVVLSALGFAFSVPFGLVFASYACTQKLMSKLLPCPTSSLRLEFGTVSDEELEEDVGFGGEVILEEEEQEPLEDKMGRVGMTIDDYQEEENDDEDVGFRGEVIFEEEEQEQLEDKMGGVGMRIDDDPEEDVGFREEVLLEEEEQEPMEDKMGGVEMRIDDDQEEKDEDQDVGEVVSEEEEQEPLEDKMGGVGMKIDEDREEKGGEREQEDDVGIRGGNALEEEEQEQTENPEGGVETRIELDGQGRKELQGDDLDDGGEYFQEGIDNYKQEPMEVIDENVKEEVYEKNVGEYLEIREEEPLERIAVREEQDHQKPVIEDSKDEDLIVEMRRVVVVVRGNERNSGDAREVEELILVARGDIGETENEDKAIDNEKEDELVRESTGLLQKLRDEGEDGHAVNESRGVAEGGDGKTSNRMEASEKSFEDKNEKLEKLNGEVKGTDGEKGAVTVFEENEGGVEEIENAFEDKNEILEKLNEEVKGTDGENGDVIVSKENEGGVEEIENAFEDKNEKFENLNGQVKGTDGEKGDETVSKQNEESMEDIEKPLEEKSVNLDKLNGDVRGTDGEKGGVAISEENEGSMEEIEKPLEEKNVKLEKLNGKVKGTDGEKREETNSDENEEIPEKRIEEKVRNIPNEVEQVGEMEGVIQGNLYVNNADNIDLAVKPIEDPNRMINGKSPTASVESIIEEQKTVVQKKAAEQGGGVEDHIATHVDKDLTLERKKENMIHSNADTREIADESGFNLHDNRSAESDQSFYTAFEISGENDNPTDSTGEADSKYTEIASETDSAKPSNEVSLSEEKIWEKINALRVIVGYNAAPYSTSIEELKALYIFTGVESPHSFKDPSDLAEVNDKLLFLMTVVGVK